MTAYGYKDNIPGTSIGNDTLSGNSGSITSGATSLKYATAPSDTLGTAGLRSTAPFIIAIGTELIIVGANTAGTKTASTLTRGAFGTTAAAHNDGDAIDMVFAAQALLDELALKAAATHTHAEADVTSLVSDLAARPTTLLGLPAIGCRCFHSANQTIVSGTATNSLLDSERFDSNNFHFTSAAALTGTVTKAAGSAAIVGSSTLFTTELSVNQVISIPGTATEIGVVKAITDNTHLTLWQNMANSASGQTATRRNEFLAIPVGYAGLYIVTFSFRLGGSNTTGLMEGLVVLNNGTAIGANAAGSTVQGFWGTVTAPYRLAEGDFVSGQVTQTTTASQTLLAGVNYSPELALAYQGN